MDILVCRVIVGRLSGDGMSEGQVNVKMIELATLPGNEARRV